MTPGGALSARIVFPSQVGCELPARSLRMVVARTPDINRLNGGREEESSASPLPDKRDVDLQEIFVRTCFS
jgi:hypothetical protein